LDPENRRGKKWAGQDEALAPIPAISKRYDANPVALPVERKQEFLGLLGQK